MERLRCERYRKQAPEIAAWGLVSGAVNIHTHIYVYNLYTYLCQST